MKPVYMTNGSVLISEGDTQVSFANQEWIELYTADRLREAQVKVLREAADDPVCGLVEQRMLRRMADELEKAT